MEDARLGGGWLEGGRDKGRTKRCKKKRRNEVISLEHKEIGESETKRSSAWQRQFHIVQQTDRETGWT